MLITPKKNRRYCGWFRFLQRVFPQLHVDSVGVLKHRRLCIAEQPLPVGHIIDQHRSEHFLKRGDGFLRNFPSVNVDADDAVVIDIQIHLGLSFAEDVMDDQRKAAFSHEDVIVGIEVVDQAHELVRHLHLVDIAEFVGKLQIFLC